MTDQVAGKYTPDEAREMAEAFAFTAARDNDHGRIAATLRAFAALVEDHAELRAFAVHKPGCRSLRCTTCHRYASISRARHRKIDFGPHLVTREPCNCGFPPEAS